MLNSQEELKLCSDITSLWYEHNQLYSQFYRDMLENYNYVVGNQLDAETKAKLDREGRPLAYWNIIKPVVLYIAGLQRSTRKKLKIEPVTPDDIATSDIMNATMDFIFEKTNKDFELSKAFVDAVIGKIGWMNCYLDYTNDAEGQIKWQSYDPFRIRTDVAYRKIDLSDCKYLMDSAFYTEKELQMIYGMNDIALYDEIEERAKPYLDTYNAKKTYSWLDRLLSGLGSYSDRLKQAIGLNTNIKTMQNDIVDVSKGLFRTIDFYDRRLVNKLVMFSPQTGENVDITQYEKDREKLNFISSNFPDYQIRRSCYEIIYVTSIVPALNLVLQDKPYPIQNGNFPFVPIFCYDLHPDILETKSIIDDLKVPQAEFNKRQSTLLDYLQRHVSGGWLAEKSAVAGVEENLLSNEMGGLKVVNDGALSGGRIQPNNPPPIPNGLRIDAQFEHELLQTISSVGMNQRGMQESSAESGRLFQARTEMGELMQTLIMDNLNRADLMIGKLTIDFIQKFLTMEKMIRINNDYEDPEWITINQPTLLGIKNDITKGKYDVVIDFSPYSRLDRQRKFMEMMEYVKIIGQLRPDYIDVASIIKASDMPYKKEWLGYIQQVEMQRQMQQQMAMQMGAGPIPEQKERQLSPFAKTNMNKEQTIQNSQAQGIF